MLPSDRYACLAHLAAPVLPAAVGGFELWRHHAYEFAVAVKFVVALWCADGGYAVSVREKADEFPDVHLDSLSSVLI